ncbi:baseplate J/gp47 family protein [Clostridium botulinum]|nr:baseplate J/gp47 family protein [Clostridium botulinum]
MEKEINFVETDATKIYTEIINEFEKAYGDTLYPADERRIFLQQCLPIIVGIKNNINDSAKQNLLRYARDEKLDALGEDIFNTERLEPQYASCIGVAKLTAIQNIDIPILAGTRITPEGNLYFKVKEDVIIPAGTLENKVILDAVEPGSKFNNFLPGQIKNIVDPTPFVESIINTSISTGGADTEGHERYRERCRLAPESYSTAGPDGAYEYWAKTASQNIFDVKIISPSPGTVRIVPLLKDGEIPDKNILDKVFSICSSRDKRPLTDKVEVISPTEVTYNIELTYYLDINHQTEELKFRKYIEGEKLDCKEGAVRDYINWQKEKLGLTINPDELRFRIQSAATYTTVENKVYTAVRRVVVNSPNFIDIKDIEVAKVGTIVVNYGGLE